MTTPYGAVFVGLKRKRTATVSDQPHPSVFNKDGVEELIHRLRRGATRLCVVCPPGAGTTYTIAKAASLLGRTVTCLHALSERFPGAPLRRKHTARATRRRLTKTPSARREKVARPARSSEPAHSGRRRPLHPQRSGGDQIHVRLHADDQRPRVRRDQRGAHAGRRHPPRQAAALC